MTVANTLTGWHLTRKACSETCLLGPTAVLRTSSTLTTSAGENLLHAAKNVRSKRKQAWLYSTAPHID